MTTHTPGPWIMQSKQKSARSRKWYEHGETITVLGCETGYFGIATVGGPSNPDMQDTMRANARLIAAAPELLEALEALLKEVSTYHKYPTMKMAKAAIAKAKGATP